MSYVLFSSLSDILPASFTIHWLFPHSIIPFILFSVLYGWERKSFLYQYVLVDSYITQWTGYDLGLIFSDLNSGDPSKWLAILKCFTSVREKARCGHSEEFVSTSEKLLSCSTIVWFWFLHERGTVLFYNTWEFKHSYILYLADFNDIWKKA